MRLLLTRKDRVGSRLRRSGSIFVAQQKRETLGGPGTVFPMQYWNKANFEGLLQAADELEERDETNGLAAYCAQRHAGLRPQAFHSLRAWLTSTKPWSEALKRQVCVVILELDARLTRVHQFLSHPLREEFLKPVLRRWYEEDRSILPTRWLGLLTRDHDLLERALDLDPSDVPVRRQLIDFALDQVDYQTHHLYEGLFIGRIDEAELAVSRAESLLNRAPFRTHFEDQVEAAAYYRRLLEDWSEYRKAPQGPFPEWCRDRGRTYAWSHAYYYDS